MTDLNFQPHVLVIAEPEPGEKEWHVEHPESCPVLCDWSPWLSDRRLGKIPPDPIFGDEDGTDPGHRSCYVEYELDGVGLDGLDVHTLTGDAHLDPGWVRASEFEADWKLLRPGRYLIEGWHQSGVGAGEYGGMGDPDGGLTLLEVLDPLLAEVPA